MKSYPLLKKINFPTDLRKLELSELPVICGEVREYLIDIMSDVGGHFASNLGTVELTVALHYVYKTPRDKLIWDVGHQVYPHKIITGRRERLRSVRRLNGLSGFPKREESEYDLYNTGHAGTSISQLIGEAVSRDILKKDYKCVCVIGDAAAATGMAFEALNHGGDLQTECTVVLNDNDMSISHNVGAFNKYLNRLITSPLYNKWRRFWFSLLVWLPVIGPAMQMFTKKLEKSFKDFMTPGSLFLDFGFRYFGPVDGHDVIELVRVLRKIKLLKGPKLLHIFTQKGKGYPPAEKDPIRFHGVPGFNRLDGSFKLAGSHTRNIPFSEIVGETMLEIMKRNKKVILVTPAMIEGSGLRVVYDKFPERVYDVGIAEQHALTFSGGLASGGLIPFVFIYATFLNRAFSQLIQDIALMNLPVRLVIDRAGCVGPDGETHQGFYDIALLLTVPNLRIFSPATGGELRSILKYMENDNSGPIVVRFPKASSSIASMNSNEEHKIDAYRPIVKNPGKKIAIIAIGIMWQTAIETEKLLRKNSGILTTLIGIRWIRPLDIRALENLLRNCEHFIIVEDGYHTGGAASYVRSKLESQINGKHLKTFAFPDESITHGRREEVFHKYGLSAEKITKYITDYKLNQEKDFPGIHDMTAVFGKEIKESR